MITITKTKVLDRFTDNKGTVFKTLAIYSPNEDNDSWVEYKNELTEQTYSCRLEAFLSRFTPLPTNT